ncbi:type II toxin-antitoxin system death-on-curing family toxin [Methanocella sp. MCL-LM]|uniref:type II toxin-antitoxin system death-on-curing family toxin n=1 Tax=Methanocella sp. MCL-LM TaxID=3412035 RepID=UPI003C76FC40
MTSYFLFSHRNQLIDIQEIAIQRNHSEADDGLEGAVREGAIGVLDYIIEQPEWVPELSADVKKYAAFVLYTIATQHPFSQANKRTAFAAAENCILLCGMGISAKDETIDMFMRSVANGDQTLEDVEKWITIHIVDKTD